MRRHRPRLGSRSGEVGLEIAELRGAHPRHELQEAVGPAEKGGGVHGAEEADAMDGRLDQRHLRVLGDA